MVDGIPRLSKNLIYLDDGWVFIFHRRKDYLTGHLWIFPFVSLILAIVMGINFLQLPGI